MTLRRWIIMARKQEMDKISIYISLARQKERPVERLIKIGAKLDRSVNYLVTEAIMQFLEREEAK